MHINVNVNSLSHSHLAWGVLLFRLLPVPSAVDPPSLRYHTWGRHWHQQWEGNLHLRLIPSFGFSTVISLWTASNMHWEGVLSPLDTSQAAVIRSAHAPLPVLGVGSDARLGYFGTIPRHKLFLCCLSQKCHLSKQLSETCRSELTPQ